MAVNEQLFANDIVTTTAAAITSSASTITVASGTGNAMPAPDSTQWFVATLTDGTNVEIVKVTNRSGDVLTVSRGQEGTTARDWPAGTLLTIAITANTASNWVQKTLLAALPFAKKLDVGVMSMWKNSTSGAFIVNPAAPTNEDDGYAPLYITAVAAVDDGVTDNSTRLNTVFSALKKANRTTHVIAIAPNGGNVKISAQVDVPSQTICDLSQVALLLADRGTIRINGSDDKWPSTNPYNLQNDATANSTTITLDASPQNGDMSKWAIGTVGIIVGQRDANGDALPNQSHEFRVTGISGTTLTITPQLPADFNVSYPSSSWPNNKSEIKIITTYPLSTSAAAGDVTVSLSTDPTSKINVGDVVAIEDERTAGDVQGTSSEPIRYEFARVKAVTTNSITFNAGLTRDYSTSYAARVRVVSFAKHSRIIGAQTLKYTGTPPSGTRYSAYEMRRALNCEITNVNQIVGNGETTFAGAAARMDMCYSCKIDRVNVAGNYNPVSGNEYGVYAKRATNCVIADGITERRRHGLVMSLCTRCTVRDWVSNGDLISGIDLHGTHNQHIVVDDIVGFEGDERASDATNAVLIRVGNSTHQAGDHNIVLRNVAGYGYADANGVINIRTPCSGVQLDNVVAFSGVDVVVLSETGTINGGDVAVGTITMRNCSGYAVDDDTTGAKFSRLQLGMVLGDGTEAGEHSVGASGAAIRPDLVTDKGKVVGQETSVTATTYDVQKADKHVSKISGSYDIRIHTLRLTAGNTTAQTVNLHNNADINDEIHVVVPDSKTASATIGLQTGATFNDGGTSWTVTAPKGGGVERVAIFTCRQNVDGSSAVWEASGDLVPKSGYYSLAHPLVAAIGRIGTLSFNANTTLSTSDEGKLLEFTGTTAATLTLPSSWSGTRGVWPVLNKGSATLTIAGGTSGTTNVTAGEGATVIRADSSWIVLPAGTFAELT